MLMKRNIYVTVLLAALLMIMVFGFESSNGRAADEYLYEVTARANMRKTPSVEGQWVMTVPYGAMVQRVGAETNGYSLVDYDGTKGYIYSNCLRKSGEQFVVPAPETKAISETPAARPVSVTRRISVINQNMTSGVFSQVSYSPAVSRSTTNVAKTAEVRMPVIYNSNFRATASSGGTRISLIPVGAEVIYLDEGENGYYHVKYQGQEGYVYSKNLDLDKRTVSVAASVAAVEKTTETSTGSMTARAFMGVSILSAGKVGTGSRRVTSTATAAMAQETAQVQAIKPEERPTVTPQISYQIGVMTNMRSTPDEADNLMATLPVGTDVTVLGKNGGYTMVQYDGMVGYVLGEHVVDSVDYAKLNGQAVLFTCTAYCPCQKCCGQYSPEVTGGEAHTATGTVPMAGRTIAVDPSVIPYGSEVSIEGMGTYIAEDCGGKVNNNHIDIFFNTHEEALQFGTKRLYVTINPK